MLNKIQIIGRLGSNPELKYTQGGSAFCSLSVATDESYINNKGEKVQHTEWHRVQVWNKQAENCASYLAKGSLIYIEGSLSTRKYQAQDGAERFMTEIKAQRVQFLDRKNNMSAQNHSTQFQHEPQNTSNGLAIGTSEMDDFPF